MKRTDTLGDLKSAVGLLCEQSIHVSDIVFASVKVS